MSSKKKPVTEKVECPQCKDHESVGFLGGNSTKKYFCRECCIEFNVRAKKIEVFEITVSGTVENK